MKFKSTVKEWIQFLETKNPDMVLAISKDSEGNAFFEIDKDYAENKTHIFLYPNEGREVEP